MIRCRLILTSTSFLWNVARLCMGSKGTVVIMMLLAIHRFLWYMSNLICLWLYSTLSCLRFVVLFLSSGNLLISCMVGEILKCGKGQIRYLLFGLLNSNAATTKFVLSIHKPLKEKDLLKSRRIQFITLEGFLFRFPRH